MLKEDPSAPCKIAVVSPEIYGPSLQMTVGIVHSEFGIDS